MESRLTRSALLLVLGVGVFLAGLELMITAVALPSIVVGLADWTQLRRASWVINAYLLVYIVTMPVAGRLSDLVGARRVFMAALALFALGSVLAGRAQSLDELIAARVVQALGGGSLVPVATAAATILYRGHARPRALGLIGALTFLGMAAGPVVGALVLERVHPDAALDRLGIGPGALAAALEPAWRWVFYLNVPIALVALALAWAAAGGLETPRRPGSVDLLGGLTLSVALAAGLLGLTLLGATRADAGGLDPVALTAILGALAALGALATIFIGLRRRDPILDPRLFRDRRFTSAVLVSLLTGYGFATAIIGGAVFVDRVLYGGPAEQQLALGSLAGATAVGALVSGFLVRRLSLRAVTVVGLGASIAGLVLMAAWTPASSIESVALALGLFGSGFGLTVTPRSTAAVEAVGRSAYGAASAAVTVARMLGMAVGLAVLTAYGSTTIDRLQAEIYATPDSYRQFIPVELRDRQLKDGLVVQALETWASGEAARIMVGIFLAAAAVTAVAAVPALTMTGRPGVAETALRRGNDQEPDRAGGDVPIGSPPSLEPTVSRPDGAADDDDRAPTLAL